MFLACFVSRAEGDPKMCFVVIPGVKNYFVATQFALCRIVVRGHLCVEETRGPVAKKKAPFHVSKETVSFDLFVVLKKRGIGSNYISKAPAGFFFF